MPEESSLVAAQVVAQQWLAWARLLVRVLLVPLELDMNSPVTRQEDHNRVLQRIKVLSLFLSLFQLTDHDYTCSLLSSCSLQFVWVMGTQCPGIDIVK